jgi:phage-related holin
LPIATDGYGPLVQGYIVVVYFTTDVIKIVVVHHLPSCSTYLILTRQFVIIGSLIHTSFLDKNFATGTYIDWENMSIKMLSEFKDLQVKIGIFNLL